MWALFSAGQILHFNPTVRESAPKQSLPTPGADEKVSSTEQRGPQSTTKTASTGNKGSLAPAPRISKASQGSSPESLILVLAQWRPLEGEGHIQAGSGLPTHKGEGSQQGPAWEQFLPVTSHTAHQSRVVLLTKGTLFTKGTQKLHCRKAPGVAALPQALSSLRLGCRTGEQGDQHTFTRTFT